MRVHPLDEMKNSRSSSGTPEESVRLSVPDESVRLSIPDSEVPSSTATTATGQIDFVLAWVEEEGEISNSDEAKEKRRVFEENLEAEGLIVEPLEGDENIKFVGLEAPSEVVWRYAEILKLRKPMRKIPGLPEDAKLTAIYNRNREFLFDLTNPNFITSNDKAKILDFILNRTRYSNDTSDDTAIGLRRLLNDEVYTGAYPLHDEAIRNKLNAKWATLGRMCCTQDLDLVKDYFGVKIGLYFTWLGFYTYMLIPASIVGIICFFYGVITLSSDQPSMDVCNWNTTDLMCPLCNQLCDYWHIKATCVFSKLTYLFDNDSTVFFALFMSLWCAVFIECWKRYSAEISHRWDLTGFDIAQEQTRPEYDEKARKTKGTKVRLHRITQEEELVIPYWRRKMPIHILSLSAVLFLISLAIAAVIGVIVYRIALVVAVSGRAKDNPGVYSWSLIVVNGTAAALNLIIILIFNWLYSLLAEVLTEMEMHRTQTSFENSLTLKMYLLQFVSCYSSIFYIAFFKGKFIGTPHKYSLIFGFRQEECGAGGCMTELCIQLATIMVGNQIINAVVEMGVPFLIRQWDKMKILQYCKGETKLFSTPVPNQSQWVKDYSLLDWNKFTLFSEYLEMVLQYGFVTIFVSAFPLAPFFALLNNMLELRWDAKKFLNNYKRPVAQRVQDIGTWYAILTAISYLSVITNAFIIALTSNFIPKLVYRLEFGSLDGYLEHSLAKFNTSDPTYLNESSPLHSIYGNSDEVKVCRYQSYRDYYFLPPEKKFNRTTFYYEVWMARLVFVVLFQNIVMTFVVIVKWLIPDIPRKLKDQIRRENYWTMQSIIAYETEQAQAKGRTRPSHSRRKLRKQNAVSTHESFK